MGAQTHTDKTNRATRLVYLSAYDDTVTFISKEDIVTSSICGCDPILLLPTAVVELTTLARSVIASGDRVMPSTEDELSS